MRIYCERITQQIIVEKAYIYSLLQSIEKNYKVATDKAKEIESCIARYAPTAELVDEMERRLTNALFDVKQINKYMQHILQATHYIQEKKEP